METARWRSIVFAVLCAMIVLAAAFSVFLEIKIRRADAAVARVAIQPRRELMAVATPAIPSPKEEGGWNPRGRWNWSIDETLVKRELQQAASAISYDRENFQEAANQIRVRLRFHELYRILDLNPSEIALFEREAARQGLTFPGLVSLDPKAEGDHDQYQARAMDGVVRNTLGPDYVEPFRAFLLTSDLRNVTAELGAHALVAGEPLTSAQADALLQLSLQMNQGAEGVTRIRPDDVDWDAVAGRAQDFLTPAQQTALRALIDRRRFDRTYKDITGLPLRRPIRGL